MTTCELTHPDDRPHAQKAFDMAISEGADYKIEHRIIRRDTGEKRYIRACGAAKVAVGQMQNTANKQSFEILVVDDEYPIRKMLKKHLTKRGYSVKTASNGQMATSYIAFQAPDVVITDLFMPDGDGFELLRHLKQYEPMLPVIVLSGKGELGDAIQALRLGAWDYVYKPIEEMSFLQLSIEKVMEKARLMTENSAYREHLEDLVSKKSAELSASEMRYRTVADFTYNWEYWIGPDKNIIYISPSCERISGYSAKEFMQKPSMLHEIICSEDRKIYLDHLEETQFQGEACRLDYRIVRPDGEKRWIGHACQPITDSSGKFLGRRCSNQDITYQKEIENDLKRQKVALLKKTISQDKANAALKTLLDQREIEKKSIEQTMVNNLKQYVFPYLDDLENRNIDTDIKTALSIVRTNIEQLIAPISNTLNAAYFQLSPTEIRVADLIRQGEPTKSIAAMLNISPSTVENHRYQIRKKLNLLNKNVNLNTHLSSLS